MIYFDNAATTPMSDAAIKALIEISSNQYGNPSSIYRFGRNSKKILNTSRNIIAKCINAEPEEIFFTSCGTESDNWVINKVGKSIGKIIISNIEHHAIKKPAENLVADGVKTVFVKVNEKCEVSLSDISEHLDGTPTLVSIMLQNNEVGVVQKIKEISQMVHADNAKSLIHTDAVQAIGHSNINVKELGVDFLSASAHKFNGPKGVGFLYIKKGCDIYPFILGGGQEHGMRSGTENLAGIYSMAKALEDNVENMELIHNHIKNLEEKLLHELDKAGIEFAINGNCENRASGVLNIYFKDLDGEGLLNMLDMHDICISIGSACNSTSQERSHVLLAMGLSEDIIDSSVRISIGRYNTESDIDQICKYIKRFYDTSMSASS